MRREKGEKEEKKEEERALCITEPLQQYRYQRPYTFKHDRYLDRRVILGILTPSVGWQQDRK